MRHVVLPSNPNLEHLKKQAKDFLAAYRAGDSQLCYRIEACLPRFEGQSIREILSAGISLHDAQHLIAQEYGFDNWSSLRAVVEVEANSVVFPGDGESVLTEEDLRGFQERGYIRVPGAFPRDKALAIQDFMWAELERFHGIRREDRSTWPVPRENQRWAQQYGLNQTKDHPIYKGIAHPRLLRAMYDIIGPRSWYKKSWGGFLISFPDMSEKPWDVGANDWHPETGPRSDLRVWRPPFVLVFTFFSHVTPQGGGTLVVEGSHRLVVPYLNSLKGLRAKKKRLFARFPRTHPWLAELMGKTADRGDRIHRFMEEGAVIDNVNLRVVELTGDPGDAILWHPALLHSRSVNRSDGPRFMRGG